LEDSLRVLKPFFALIQNFLSGSKNELGWNYFTELAKEKYLSGLLYERKNTYSVKNSPAISWC